MKQFCLLILLSGCAACGSQSIGHWTTPSEDRDNQSALKIIQPLGPATTVERRPGGRALQTVHLGDGTTQITIVEVSDD